MSHLRSSFARRQQHNAVIGAPAHAESQGSNLISATARYIDWEPPLNTFLGRHSGGSDAAFYAIEARANSHPPHCFVIPAGGPHLPRPEKIAAALRTALGRIGLPNSVISSVNYTARYVSVGPAVAEAIAQAQRDPAQWASLSEAYQQAVQRPAGVAR